MTELQIQIVELMAIAGIEEECCERVMEYLETEEQQKQMLKFMKEHPTATNNQVATKTIEIIKN